LRANNLFSCAIDAHLMHGAARWRGLPLDGTYPSGRPGRRILERRVSQQTASQMPTPAPPANCSPARLDAIWHLIQINGWQAIFVEHPDALTPSFRDAESPPVHNTRWRALAGRSRASATAGSNRSSDRRQPFKPARRPHLNSRFLTRRLLRNSFSGSWLGG
jgi:hypothetical protein